MIVFYTKSYCVFPSVQCCIISLRFSENKNLCIWSSDGLKTILGNGVLYTLTHLQMKKADSVTLLPSKHNALCDFLFFNSQHCQFSSRHSLIKRGKVLILPGQNSLFGWAFFPVAALAVLLLKDMVLCPSCSSATFSVNKISTQLPLISYFSLTLSVQRKKLLGGRRQIYFLFIASMTLLPPN